MPRGIAPPTPPGLRVCTGVTTRSVKNRTLRRQSNEISGLKSKAFAYRGGLLGTRHRNFPFKPLPDTAARGGTDEPNLLACSFEQIVYPKKASITRVPPVRLAHSGPGGTAGPASAYTRN